MLLSLRCADDFTRKTRTRGAEYARQWHVRISFDGDGLIQAHVSGGDGKHTVFLDWQADHHEIDAGYSCAHFLEGYLCKHIWATIAQLDAAGLSHRFGGSGPVYVSPGEPVDEDDFEDDDRFGDDAASWNFRRANGRWRTPSSRRTRA